MSFLQTILNNRLKSRDERMSFEELKSRANDEKPTRKFLGAIMHRNPIAVIAEIKFRTPTQGIINASADVATLAKSYETSGAHALSVLTEPHEFNGKLEFLNEAKAATSLPVLRKDFLYDKRDIYESRAYGADAVLLIAKMLSQSKLEDLCALCTELGLGVLLELHEEADLQKSKNISNIAWGVNHRNLDTLKIDLNVSQTLFSLIHQRPRVAESGLRSRDDILLMKRRGADAVLIGSHFMEQKDPGMALRRMLREPVD